MICTLVKCTCRLQVLRYGMFTNVSKLKKYRVVCPNFRHYALTPSFTKYKFLQVKNSFATLVNEFFSFEIVSAFELRFIVFAA